MKVPEAGFSVTYTMNRFQPVTIPVQLVQGDPATVNPNPVVAELQPAGPPPKPVRKRDEAEKAETTQGRAGACRRLAVPRPGASPGGRRSAARRRAGAGPAARPVIAALQ